MLASKERLINTNPVVDAQPSQSPAPTRRASAGDPSWVEGVVEVIRAIYAAARAPWV
jgi:hypothetical protein